MLLLVSTTCGPILTEGFSILTTIWCLAFLGIFLSSGFLELHTFSNTLRVLLAVFMGWLVLGTSKVNVIIKYSTTRVVS
jgi:hypothetical protein